MGVDVFHGSCMVMVGHETSPSAVGAFVEAWAPPSYTSAHIRVDPSVNMANTPLVRE